MGRLEPIRRHSQSQQRDEPIGRDSRDTSSGHQRGERDLTGQNSTQDEGSEDVHHGDRVLGLPVFRDFADPARHREDTVTGDSVYETGGSDDGHAGVLEVMVSTGIYVDDGMRY